MALTEEEKKKKAQAEYAKKQKMLKSAKKSGTVEPKMTKEEAKESVKQQNEKVEKAAKEEKRIMAGRTDPALYKTETKSEPKKVTNNVSGKAQQFSSIGEKPASYSAKAVSSEAEKDYNKLPISPIQRGKQTVGENIARLAGVEQETLDDIRAKAIPKFGKDVFSESVDSGVANYISNLTGSLGKIYELSPNGFIANSLNKAIYGETRNPFEAINEPLQKWQEKEALEAQKAVENTGKGKSAENASRLITMATEMAPSVALSFIPGGQASSIANAAGTLGKVKGGFKALTSAKTFFPTLQQMTLSTIKDPVFWNSFGQILYPEYEEAVAKGASEGEATATALLSAFGQSALEKNFGIEKLPEAGAQTVKQAVFDFVKSAVGEGNEEVIQSIISGITQKLIFDHDQKLVSTSPEEDAVLNMADAFDEWIMAVAAGGVMGIPGALVNAGNIKAEANTNTSVEPVAEPPVSPAEAPIAEAENDTPKTTNEQEGTFANVGEKVETEKENDVEKAPEETLKNLREQFDKGEISKEEYLAKNYENLSKYFEERKNANAQVNSTNDVIDSANDAIEPANAQPRAQGDGGFGTNTVGAAQSNPTSYAHLQNEHGVHEQGEGPVARDSNVPLKDAQGNRTSKATATIMDAKVTPDELIPAFEKEVAAGTFVNRGTTNKETVDKAAQKIASYKTLDEAVNDFRKVYSDDKILSKDDLVFGEILYSMAAEAGANDTAIELASMLVSNNSRTGDAMQAQRILKRLSPEGRLYHAQQITNKFNKDKHQKTEIKLSEETIKKVLDAKTDKEIEAANDAVAEDIAKQIDKGLFEDIAGIVNAWRYLSMLGNPKTHIRNFFGNVAFLPARKIKNLVKAGIENVAYKANWIDEKTASVKLASKENREFAKESFKKNKKSLLSGGNYRFESEIDSKIEPFRFSGKETPVKKFFNAVLTPARKAAEFNSNALEAEDVLFFKNAYIDSLTQYLTANKIDAKNMTPAQKANAESYAAQEAQKATFRDYSAISSALEKLANTTIPIGKDKKALEIYGIKVKPFKFLVEANIPFRKTPINVLARGIEYSPVGLAKALTIDTILLKNGDITANEMIDHISSGLTGSGVVALGAALALKGVLTAGEKEDENEQAFDELQGKQNYALNFGDGSYTIDWLSPTAIPLFIGAEAVQAAKEEYGDNPNWEQIAYSLLKNLDTIADPILELSMLDNLNKLLSGNYGKDGSAIAGLMKDSATSYALQLIPTLSSQIAQTIDGTRRNAYYVDKTDNIPDDWQILVQRAKAKIPGLSKELPAYVDAWGRTQKQSDNVGVRIAENFLSPGYYKKKTVTETDKMLKQLIKQTGDTSLAPKGPSQKYVTVDGANHPLSAKEYEQMSIEKGKKQYDIINQLVANKTYTQLDAETKAKAIKGVYEYSGALSKEGVHGYKLPKEWVKAEKAKEDGLAEGTYISLKSSMSGKEKDIDKMEYLIADKGTSPKEKVVAMEYLTDINMKKYEKFSKDPKDIINARMIYLEEHAKGGEGTTARIVDRMIKDKGTNAKEDVAFMENVLNMNMEKYKSATGNSKEQLELYKVVSDDAKKEEDIKALAKKGYSSEEALAKYNVSSGTKKYENGEFKFGNSTKQKAKAEKLKAKGYDPKTIVKAANAVTSIGKYGTSKSYSTCIEMLKAVGITDKKFQNDFYNIYFG